MSRRGIASAVACVLGLLASVGAFAADVRLAGSVEVRDSERPGAARPIASGTLDLRVFTPRDGLVVRTLAVTAGLFEATVPEDARLGVGAMVLDDRWADPDDRGFGPVPEDGRFLVRATWGEDMVLRVVDSETGSDVRDVTVFLSRRMAVAPLVDASELSFTAPNDVVADRVAPPVRLSSWRRLAAAELAIDYVLRAPGYARKSVPVRGSGGERVVALVPVAGLEVTLENDELSIEPASENELFTWTEHPRTLPALRPVLTLRRRGDPRESAVRRRILRPRTPELFEPLEPGEYEVAVEIGLKSARPIRLASSVLTLAKARLTSATLRLADPPQLRRVEVALAVPDGWDRDFEVAIEPVDVPGVEAWRRTVVIDAGEREGTVGLLPGRWIARTRPFGPTLEFTVETTGAPERLAFAVPPPAEVRLRLVDSATGRPLAPPSVAWAAAPAAGSEPEFSTVERTAGDVYRFIGPAEAAIHVEVDGREHAGRRTIGPVGLGVNEISLSWDRAAAFVLDFAAEPGTDLPGLDALRASIDAREILGGDGDGAVLAIELLPSAADVARFRVVVTRAGRYRVSVGEKAGLRVSAEPFEIDVRPGGEPPWRRIGVARRD